MTTGCRYERDVLQGKWTDSLRAHMATCADCAAAAEVAPWMEQFAATDVRRHILPDPAVVWLKAQLLRNTVGVDRAVRPVTNFQAAAYMIVAAGWAALLTWKWSALQAWLLRFSPSHLLGAASGTAAASASVTFSFFAVVIVLLSITVLLGLHTILAEE